MAISGVIDYTRVTEVPGGKASRRQLAMLHSRYGHAAAFCKGRDVLEVGCGSGIGLGYLARRARRVVGADYSAELLAMARRHYGSRLPLVRLDAHRLPFRAGSFDVVILYEAIYYLARPAEFAGECRRVLRRDGVALLCTVNRDWADFNPSPFSTRYFSGPELVALLEASGFEVQLYGAFRAQLESARDVAVSLVKRAAVGLGLMPQTMKGKERLKRLAFGRLSPLPPELPDDVAAYEVPEPISAADAPAYTILHAVAYAR